MTTILGISGSLRTASLNAALLRAAVDLMPPGTTLDANGIEGIPLYIGDEEAAHGIPPAVAEQKRKILDGTGSCSSPRSTTIRFRASSRTPSTG